MPVTDIWADRLVVLAGDLRPHGARRWDAAGIRAAIRKVQHLALGDVTKAVVNAAEDPKLETPAPIGITTSPCWRERVPDRATVHETYDPTVTCGICGKPERTCRANRWAEHDYIDAVHDAIANPKRPADAMRAIVQDAKNSIATTEPKEQPMTEHQPNEHVEELRAALAGASEVEA